MVSGWIKTNNYEVIRGEGRGAGPAEEVEGG